MIWNYLSQIITIFSIIIHMNNSTHGLCKECLTVNISEMQTEKVTKCLAVRKIQLFCTTKILIARLVT